MPIIVSRRGPLEMRHSLGPDLAICDGSTFWNKKASGSAKMYAATAKECNPVALRWDPLDSLQSAVLVRKDASLGCTLVRAESEYTLSAGLEIDLPDEVFGLVRGICG
jgi:hypothetical protein